MIRLLKRLFKKKRTLVTVREKRTGTVVAWVELSKDSFTSITPDNLYVRVDEL